MMKSAFNHITQKKMTERYIAFRTSDPQILAHLRGFSNKHSKPKEPTTQDIIKEAWKGSKQAFVESLSKESDVIRAAHFLRGQSEATVPLPPSQQPTTTTTTTSSLSGNKPLMKGSFEHSKIRLTFPIEERGDDDDDDVDVSGGGGGMDVESHQTVEFPVSTPQTLIELYTNEPHGVESMKKIGDVDGVAIDRRSLSLPQQLVPQPPHILPQTAVLASEGAFECPEWKPIQANSKSRIQAMSLMLNSIQAIKSGEPTKVNFETTIDQVPSWVAPSPSDVRRHQQMNDQQQQQQQHRVHSFHTTSSIVAAALQETNQAEVRYPANPYRPPPPRPPPPPSTSTKTKTKTSQADKSQNTNKKTTNTTTARDLSTQQVSNIQEEWSFTQAIRTRHGVVQQQLQQQKQKQSS